MGFTDILHGLELSPLEWGLALLCGFLVGAAKMGLAGAGLLVVPVLAHIFGGKMSTGLLLPMLIIADIMAVSYYSRHANWYYLMRLIPWALAGVVIGVWVGNEISDELFKNLIAGVIFLCIGLMIWRDTKREDLKIPPYWWLAASFGMVGGFATMIGNAAGPIMAIYLLSMRLPKNNYIGTAAWFFLIINLSKVPFHAYIWETINVASLSFNLAMIPAIILGVVTGVRIVKIIPENIYRIFIICSTILSALLLFF